MSCSLAVVSSFLQLTAQATLVVMTDDGSPSLPKSLVMRDGHNSELSQEKEGTVVLEL